MTNIIPNRKNIIILLLLISTISYQCHIDNNTENKNLKGSLGTISSIITAFNIGLRNYIVEAQDSNNYNSPNVLHSYLNSTIDIDTELYDNETYLIEPSTSFLDDENNNVNTTTHIPVEKDDTNIWYSGLFTNTEYIIISASSIAAFAVCCTCCCCKKIRKGTWKACVKAFHVPRMLCKYCGLCLICSGECCLTMGDKEIRKRKISKFKEKHVDKLKHNDFDYEQENNELRQSNVSNPYKPIHHNKDLIVNNHIAMEMENIMEKKSNTNKNQNLTKTNNPPKGKKNTRNKKENQSAALLDDDQMENINSNKPIHDKQISQISLIGNMKVSRSEYNELEKELEAIQYENNYNSCPPLIKMETSVINTDDEQIRVDDDQEQDEKVEEEKNEETTDGTKSFSMIVTPPPTGLEVPNDENLSMHTPQSSMNTEYTGSRISIISRGAFINDAMDNNDDDDDILNDIQNEINALPEGDNTTKIDGK